MKLGRGGFAFTVGDRPDPAPLDSRFTGGDSRVSCPAARDLELSFGESGPVAHCCCSIEFMWSREESCLKKLSDVQNELSLSNSFPLFRSTVRANRPRRMQSAPMQIIKTSKTKTPACHTENGSGTRPNIRDPRGGYAEIR
jgi:hypothetical protein